MNCIADSSPPSTHCLKQYLESTEIIDWQHPHVSAMADELRGSLSDQTGIAKKCFEWVRDNIRHSHDFQCNPITCKASEALIHATGYCYAKSHLLAALLRANGIPAGICYQRLTRSGNRAPFCLHSLNAVYLADFGWFRIDARGNKDNVNARFEPPAEYLAYQPEIEGEADIPLVFEEPLPIVVDVLRKYHSWQDVYENLPDLETVSGVR